MPQQSAFTIKLMVTLAVGAFFLAIGFYWWYTQNVHLTNVASSADHIRGENERILKELHDKGKLENDQEQFNLQLSKIDQTLTDTEYMPTYLTQLQQRAIDTGNKIQTFQPGEMKVIDLRSSPLGEGNADAGKPNQAVIQETAPAPGSEKKEKEKKYQVQQINLEVVGTYVSIMRFLEALRTFPKLVYVRTLNINPRNTGRDNNGQLIVRFETYAVITPEQYEKGKGKPPVAIGLPNPNAPVPASSAPASPVKGGAR